MYHARLCDLLDVLEISLLREGMQKNMLALSSKYLSASESEAPQANSRFTKSGLDSLLRSARACGLLNLVLGLYLSLLYLGFANAFCPSCCNHRKDFCSAEDRHPDILGIQPGFLTFCPFSHLNATALAILLQS